MLDRFLHTCIAANACPGSPWDPVTAIAPLPGTHPEAIHDSRAAMTWFASEHLVLMALVEQAPDELSWRLAHTMVTYLDRHGHGRDLVTTQRVALAAAERLADPTVLAMAHRLVGRAQPRWDYEASRHHLDEALIAFQASDDTSGQVHTIGW